MKQFYWGQNESPCSVVPHMSGSNTVHELKPQLPLLNAAFNMTTIKQEKPELPVNVTVKQEKLENGAPVLKDVNSKEGNGVTISEPPQDLPRPVKVTVKQENGGPSSQPLNITVKQESGATVLQPVLDLPCPVNVTVKQEGLRVMTVKQEDNRMLQEPGMMFKIESVMSLAEDQAGSRLVISDVRHCAEGWQDTATPRQFYISLSPSKVIPEAPPPIYILQAEQDDDYKENMPTVQVCSQTSTQHSDTCHEQPRTWKAA